MVNFRPLLEFFIFQLYGIGPECSEKVFPSPIGVLYISINAGYDSGEILKTFPSPIGVLYISINKVLVVCGVNSSFPSPIGVLYISILLMYRSMKSLSISVPYWSSLYFNPVLCSPYNYRAAKPDCSAKPNPAFYHLKI